MREFFSSSTLLAFIDLPFLVVALLLLGYIGGPLVILPLCAIPVLIITGIVLQEAGKRTAEQGYKQNMQKNALLVELVNGLETLKACMAESRMLHLWEQVVGVSAKAGRVAKNTTTSPSPFPRWSRRPCPWGWSSGASIGSPTAP